MTGAATVNRAQTLQPITAQHGRRISPSTEPTVIHSCFERACTTHHVEHAQHIEQIKYGERTQALHSCRFLFV